MKKAKGQTQATPELISGPKYCHHTGVCDHSAPCIGTGDQFIENLKELLNGEGVWRCLCDDAALMSRIQNMKYAPSPAQTLNQYGAYWAFASGMDVLDHYLYLAMTLQDEAAWIKEALIYVGFSASQAADPGKQQLVIFDQNKMDDLWLMGTPDGKHGHMSFQPRWEDGVESIFDYLASPFQVCFNEDKDNGNTITDATMCYERTVPIPEEAKNGILTQNYEKITGCGGGYPLPEDRYKMTLGDCIDYCPGANGVEYCGYSDRMNQENRVSSVACIDYYLANYELVSGESAVMMARAFFENCLSFNYLFTGLGLGYSQVARNTTGTEWLVRGDIDLHLLGASEPYPLGA